VAFAVLFGLLAGVLWPFPTFRNSCIFASTLSIILAIYCGFKSRKDPYSLDTLREMVIEGTYDEADVPEIPEDADVYCMCCNHVYGSRFKVCPKCGR